MFDWYSSIIYENLESWKISVGYKPLDRVLGSKFFESHLSVRILEKYRRDVVSFLSQYAIFGKSDVSF